MDNDTVNKFSHAPSDRHPLKVIPVRSLMMDLENPRYAWRGHFESERDVISYLTAQEKIREIAIDIVKYGLCGFDLFAVIYNEFEEIGITIEGNRRLCALKLLLDPELATTEEDVEYYKKITERLREPIPNRVDCRLFESREDCDHWMAIKHATHKGEGIVRWSRRRREYVIPPTQKRLAKQFLRYAELNKLVSQDDMYKISISTVGKLLSDEEIRKITRITNKRDLVTNISQEEFNKIVSAFLKYCVNMFTDAMPVPDMIKQFTEDLKNHVSNLDLYIIAKIKLTPPDWKEKYDDVGLIPTKWIGLSYIGESASEQRIRAIVRDLQVMDYKKSPSPTACLLRNLIEQIFLLYIGIDSTSKRNSLDSIFETVADKLSREYKDKDHAKTLRNALKNKHENMSPAVLNSWAHGKLIPSSGDLEEVWSQVRPIFEAILRSMHVKKR